MLDLRSQLLPRQGGGSGPKRAKVGLLGVLIRVSDSIDRKVGQPPQDEYWQMSCDRSEQVKCVLRVFALVTLIWRSK
jgi:hypothetical protein